MLWLPFETDHIFVSEADLLQTRMQGKQPVNTFNKNLVPMLDAAEP